MIRKLLERIGIRKKESAFMRLSKQLLEFSSAFSTITDVSQLVPTAIGKIRDLMGVKEAALFLKNRQNGQFELAYSRNIMLNPKLRMRGDYYFEESDKLIRWLLTNRKAFVMSNMTDVFSYFPEEEQDILRFINTEMCLGLEAHNRFIGVISLGRRIDGSDFEDTDMQLLAPIAAQAALAIENYRLQQEALEQVRAKRELEIAGELQSRLLPGSPPQDIPELDINGLCIPSSEVGGDYFDYISLPDRKLAIVIGDVAGHGMSAGLLMGMAKSCINTAVKIDHSVLQVMNTVNEMICELSEKTAMMTLIIAVLDIDTNTLTFSNAGHLYPYYYDSESDKISNIESESYPLGIRYDFPFPVKTLKMKAGDFLLSCSDGFIEAENRNGEIFGFTRFEECVHKHRDKNSSDLIHSIKDDFFQFLAGQAHIDDLTLLAMRIKG